MLYLIFGILFIVVSIFMMYIFSQDYFDGCENTETAMIGFFGGLFIFLTGILFLCESYNTHNNKVYECKRTCEQRCEQIDE